MIASRQFRLVSLTAFILGCATALYGQNLIPNAGFEDLDRPCFGSTTYIDLANWVTADCGAGGGYLNACSTQNGFPNSGTPANLAGYQVPLDGVAYAVTWTYNPPTTFPPTYYLSVPLTEPLESGVEYCFTARVSLADQSVYRTRDLHVMLTEAFPSTCDGQDTLDWLNNAQLTLNTTDVDTVSWSALSGSFIAAGGEQYLTIGDFNLQSAPDTIYIGPSSFPVPRAMYYVDMVELRTCESAVQETDPEQLAALFDPSVQTITLRSRTDGRLAEVQLLDLAGRVVRNSSSNSAMVQLDVSTLPRAVYVVQAELEGVWYSRRVAVY